MDTSVDHLRKRYPAFGRGSLELLHPDNRRVLAFLRRAREEPLLVVANLSRFTQYVELDLTACRGLVPVELFGRTVFPPVDDRPYVLTLAPYAFHWFALEPPPGAALPALAARATPAVPTLTASGPWEAVVRGEAAGLEEVLLEYLQRCRWFGGRGERILSMTCMENWPASKEPTPAYLTLFQIEYAERDPEIYVIPLAFASGARARELLRHRRQAVIARHRLLGPWGGTDGVLYDAMWHPRFVRSLLSAAVRRRPRGRTGPLQGPCTLSIERAQSTVPPARMPISLPRDESNTTVVCGGWGVLKLFRRTEAGTNPDLEIGRFLTARSFAHTPPLVGALEHHQRYRRPTALALVQRYVPHDCDAWEYTLKRLRRDLARARSSPAQVPTVSLAAAALLGRGHARAADAGARGVRRHVAAGAAPRASHGGAAPGAGLGNDGPGVCS